MRFRNGNRPPDEEAMMESRELFRTGRLKEAIEAAVEDVRGSPADVEKRSFLCELMCLAGDHVRADRQLDALGNLDPKYAVGVSLLRHLVRAEGARRQFHADGRVPEFLEQPSEELRLRLQAAVCLRTGDAREAARLLEAAEEKRAPVGGTSDGVPFDDFRDLDDTTASFFEVLTTNGKYYWIPIGRVDLVEFEAPGHPYELLWRRARLVVRGGPDGIVYLPALYQGSHLHADDSFRLGRATDWQGGGDDAPVRGVGQRTFLVGDRDVPIMDLKKIEFAGSAG
jgi:type VI secretion system protein ImpE